MSDPLPRFERPPVVETVLGVQFERLVDFSAAHAGWFWKTQLPEEFRTAKEAPRLEDQFERFGDERVWAPVGGGLLFRPGMQPDRIQIVNSPGDRMVQIQDSRFIYNWRKKDIGYPSYNVLLPEFQTMFERFRAFAREAMLPTVEPNQWEVTYVNQIPLGELWTSPGDWPRVVPGLFTQSIPGLAEFESFGGEWHLLLGHNRGRLHMALRHGRPMPDGPEAMMLTLTARGPVDAERSWESGLNLGHEAIVRGFAAITSAEAHRHWGRTV